MNTPAAADQKSSVASGQRADGKESSQSAIAVSVALAASMGLFNISQAAKLLFDFLLLRLFLEGCQLALAKMDHQFLRRGIASLCRELRKPLIEGLVDGDPLSTERRQVSSC